MVPADRQEVCVRRSGRADISLSSIVSRASFCQRCKPFAADHVCLAGALDHVSLTLAHTLALASVFALVAALHGQDCCARGVAFVCWMAAHMAHTLQYNERARFSRTSTCMHAHVCVHPCHVRHTGTSETRLARSSGRSRSSTCLQ
jgi:hypothetical protein